MGIKKLYHGIVHPSRKSVVESERMPFTSSYSDAIASASTAPMQSPPKNTSSYFFDKSL